MTWFSQITNRLARKDVAGWAVLAALVCALPSLWAGFATDDHHFRVLFQGMPGLSDLTASPLDTFVFTDGNPEHNALRVDRGLLPWWVSPGWKISFWRPIASISHWIDFQVWGDRAWPMHLHSILLYGLLAYLAARLYRRLTPTAAIAGLAGLLYAVAGAHALPVGWLANRNAVLSCLFGVLTLLAHDRWRRDGGRTGPILVMAAQSLALLCGEAAVATFGYVLAYSLFIDCGTRKSRFAATLPTLSVILIWRVIYNHGGHGATSTFLYVDPVQDPVFFIVNALQRLPLLLFGLFGFPDPTVWTFLPGMLAHAWFVLALAFVVFCAAHLSPQLRRDPVARFWALGMLLSAIPFCATVPQNRLLLYPGLGAMALISQFLLTEPVPGSRPLPGRRLLTRVWVAIHLVAAPLVLAFGSYGIALVEQTFKQTNESVSSMPGLDQKTVIIVNAPGDLLGVSLPFYRSSMHEPVPQQMRLLYAGIRDLTILRPDAQTLVVRPLGGFLERPWAQIFRQPRQNPFHAGDQVLLPGMTVTVSAVTQDGRPAEAVFRFDKPLDDPSYLWLTWNHGVYIPFTLPQPGASTAAVGWPLPWGLSAWDRPPGL